MTNLPIFDNLHKLLHALTNICTTAVTKKYLSCHTIPPLGMQIIINGLKMRNGNYESSQKNNF